MRAIAVCGSADLSASSGSLQYRFGKPAAIELSYPPDGADWRDAVRAGTLTFSGGGGAFLAFTNAPYRYVVYSAVRKGVRRKAGVVVEQDGKRIASWVCRGKALSELGPDLFSRADIRPADDDFDLP